MSRHSHFLGTVHILLSAFGVNHSKGLPDGIARFYQHLPMKNTCKLSRERECDVQSATCPLLSVCHDDLKSVTTSK